MDETYFQVNIDKKFGLAPHRSRLVLIAGGLGMTLVLRMTGGAGAKSECWSELSHSWNTGAIKCNHGFGWTVKG